MIDFDVAFASNSSDANLSILQHVFQKGRYRMQTCGIEPFT